MMRLLVVGILPILVWGCGKGNGDLPLSRTTPTEQAEDYHPDGWRSSHGDAVVDGATYCGSCHGTSSVGGAGANGVSCYDCHGADGSALAGDPALSALLIDVVSGILSIDHPSGFESETVTDETIPFYTFDAARHGYIAKADNLDDSVPVGFDFCAGCHTDDFTGRSLPTPPFPGDSANCVGCHGNGTPHSPNLDEWASYHHITTSPQNAAVCANCHAGGNNSPLPPPTPDPSVSNACFNGTLCHTGDIVTTPIVDHFEGHWNFHQRNPEACKICHGDDFQGRGDAPACYSCHNGQTAPRCTTCHEASTLPAAKSTRTVRTTSRAVPAAAAAKPKFTR